MAIWIGCGADGCFLLILNLRRSDFFALWVALRPKNGW